MKLYYAHHIWKYDTKIEDYEIEVVKSCFTDGVEIVNPKTAAEQNKDSKLIMEDCLRIIQRCDGLVFSSISGVVGKGVYREVEKALKDNKPIYYIFYNTLHSEITMDNLKIINPDNPNNRVYAEVRI